jgi:GNAT superfamily N-acetyltransferase
MSTSSEAQPRPDVSASAPGEVQESSDFTVRVATLEEWQQVTEWANGEGWNMGYHDAECFFAVDPDGFFIGRVGDRPVASVSVVNYSDDYSVWGHFLVDPTYRGKDYGRKIWRAASQHRGDRVAGGDGTPEMAPIYQFLGGNRVHDTIHYFGQLDRAGTPAEGVVRVGTEHLDAIAAYDSECFPADRRRFLAKWLFADGHLAYAGLRDGRITGYGVIRPAPIAYRVGPLFADTPQDAEALFETLTAHLAPGDSVSAFTPETQEAAGPMFLARGLDEQFRLVRLYQGGPAPKAKFRAESIYAIGSIELG